MFDDTETLGLLAVVTQFPAITIPMGHLGGRIPMGIEFLGRPWSEETLLRLAYAFERATKHRRAPETAPPLGRSQ
jgi:Asp-tRNA(Asn)/Glu-tRNA(Gln) amidotransferase A subunit family amidase